MYDMYPANWRVVDEHERKAERHRDRRRSPEPDAEPVQEAMNRRDNGGEPTQ